MRRDLIVVGASAGGVEALRDLVAGLPPELPAAVAVVLHLPAGGSSALAQILSRAGPLPAVSAGSGMPLVEGRVHVAPPDRHLLVVGDHLVLSEGPTENGHRPAVDALFRSAATAAGARTVGVLLSGVLNDGVAGLVAIRARGGAVVVQHPEDALYPGMPENALRHVDADLVLPARDIGPALGLLASGSVDQAPERRRDETFERAVWAGLRSLEERERLATRMGDAAGDKGDGNRAGRYRRQAEEAGQAAEVLRRFLLSRDE
ncbi:hypothetical protein GCM10023148_02560 [Actinokineospora soli]